MALQRQSFSRQAWDEHQPKGDSKYFKLDLKWDASKKSGEKMRGKFLPWVKNGAIVTAFPILIGWAKVKGKDKPQPIRFEIDEDIPEMEWAEQVNKFNGKTERQTPKPCICGIFFYKDNEGNGHAALTEIKQSSVASAIFSKTDPNDESYIEDLENYDFIIHRKEEKKYHVELFPKPTPLTMEHTEAVNKLLESSEDHTLSLEAYMNGEDPFGGGGAGIEDTGLYPLEEKEPTHMRIKRPASSAKESTKTEKSEASDDDGVDSETFNFNPDWSKFVTGKNTKIGEASMEDLQIMRKTLKDRNKATGQTWDAICSAIKDQSEGAVVFNDEEEAF